MSDEHKCIISTSYRNYYKAEKQKPIIIKIKLVVDIFPNHPTMTILINYFLDARRLLLLNIVTFCKVEHVHV